MLRVRLAKDLASGSNAASVRIRTAKRPYYVQSRGNYGGSVTVQHSTDSFEVADADAVWRNLGTLAGTNPGDAISIDHPMYRVRVSGTHSSGSATVDLIESAAS